MQRTHECLNKIRLVKGEREAEKMEIEAKLVSFQNDNGQQMGMIRQKIL